jgi:hypothetical protein
VEHFSRTLSAHGLQLVLSTDSEHYLYVDLGTEHNYQPSAKDDPNTEYKIFRTCSVYIAETEEKLDRGEYVSSTKGTTVIIYC